MALLQLISRASVMTMEERNRIVPLLSLFCSLFSHSLLSLHDAEFYEDDSGEMLTMLLVRQSEIYAYRAFIDIYMYICLFRQILINIFIILSRYLPSVPDEV